MSTTLSHYQQRIAAVVPEADPRHVEAFMRLEHPTLDGLAPSRFDAEARICAVCVHEAGPAESEALAASYGL